MSPARRYAEGTTVTVDASRGEITGILAKHGVQKMGWMADVGGDELLFELAGGSYRLQIKKPTTEEVRKLYAHLYANQVPRKLDEEWRRRWRATVLLLKAKLEFATAGDTTIERELLSYRVLSDGRTVEDLIIAGGLPMLTTGKEPVRT